MTNRITSEDVYTKAVGALYEEAGMSCKPAAGETLLELAVDHGVGEDSLVLDIGCANGGVSRRLLDRTGCRIEGVELLQFLVDMGKAENEKLSGTDRFTIQQGTITDIPFSDDQFDFVFCNDVIGLVDDLPTAVAECRRVVKTRRTVLIYASYGTQRLSEREARELTGSLGGAERGLDVAHAEQCIRASFSMTEKIVIGSRFTQHDTEERKDQSQAAADLLKVARLLTWPERYIRKYGQRTYDIVLAEAHWSPYILLGKVEPTVFIARKM